MRNHMHSKSTERAIRQRFHDQTSGASIHVAYRSGMLSAEETVRRLSKLEAEYKVVAGQIAVEIAHQSAESDESASLEWLQRADSILEHASREERLSARPLQVNRAKAEALRSQLTNYAAIGTFRYLPLPEVADRNYQSLVKVGGHLADQWHNSYGHAPAAQRHEANGALGEIAVLALTQRYALQSGIGSRNWFAVPALHAEDSNQNRHGSVLNRAWDMSVFQADPVSGDEVPHLVYKVQVKSSDTQQRREDAPGISLVCVSPDLEIYSGEHSVASHVIRACLREVDGVANSRTRHQLDVRTDQLLERFDDVAGPVDMTASSLGIQ